MARQELEHPAVDQMAATPEILRLMMAPVGDDQSRWKPGLDRWSIAEILEHLSHIEGHYFRAALERIVNAEGAEIEPYDQNAYDAAGAYAGREPEESFAHWEEQRENNVAYLQGLDPSALTRAGKHPEVGRITAGEILNEWALHDLGHVRQIAELVRAIVYYPEIGAFQSHYKMNP